MKISAASLLHSFVPALLAFVPAFCASTDSPVLHAHVYNSGFPLGRATFNGMGVAHDGTIYYVITSESYNVAAQMYSLNPKTQKITHLGDLSEAVGEKNAKVVAQGKSHVAFIEDDGKLYFATHLGYYHQVAGIERAGAPPAGYRPYQGGHFLAFDIKTGKFTDLATAPDHQGIISMNMDRKRGRLYGITWPTGHFIRYDLKTQQLKDLGTFFQQGEIGKGPTYRTICRSIAIDPRDGSAYFTTGDGIIHRYSYGKDAVEDVIGANLKKDYFGSYDATAPGSMAYNWRRVVWDSSENVFYGVHGGSGYLFRFDPRVPSVEVLDRLTSLASQRSGMRDRFDYGYLGFDLGLDGHTLYYLTGAPIYENGKLDRRQEDFHLITYDIPNHKYLDHGRIMLDNGNRPQDINSIAVGLDGAVYSIATLGPGKEDRADLIAFHP